MILSLSVLDRINVGNAHVAGMSRSLDLRGNQLSIAVAVFYVSYVLTELFANLTLRFSKLNLLLGGSMFAWCVLLAASDRIFDRY
jgi:hypothetical protein